MENAEQTFNALRQILAAYQETMEVKVNDPTHFYLNTQHKMKNGQPLYFGSCKVNKRYVSFHLMPVYVFPELLDKLSPALKTRMQGKSCFNFTKIDDACFAELEALTKAGFLAYQREGYV